jgi:hypothetical protein
MREYIILNMELQKREIMYDKSNVILFLLCTL